MLASGIDLANDLYTSANKFLWSKYRLEWLADVIDKNLAVTLAILTEYTMAGRLGAPLELRGRGQGSGGGGHYLTK